MMPLSKRITAELFGTFWLVFGGCGSAVLAAAFPTLGIGFAGVALFAGGDFVGQLWLFWVMPLAGAALAGFFYRYLFSEQAQQRV